MTWPSHLLPNGRNSVRRASNRHRRIINLERLEDRTVLSNVTVSMLSLPSTVLTITGDIHNDSFSITENLDGTVTVASTSPQTTINGTGKAVTTPTGVTEIDVTLPGTTNFDTVSLFGQGKTVPTSVRDVTISAATGVNLNLVVAGVDNSGALSVTEDATPGSNDGALTVRVTDSTFGSLSILQTGCCLADITLGNDNVP